MCVCYKGLVPCCQQHHEGMRVLVCAGQGKGHLLQDLREEDTWLEFGVHFKKEGREQWIKEKDLNCPVLVRLQDLYHQHRHLSAGLLSWDLPDRRQVQ